MTQKEMLDKLGTTQDEFNSYREKTSRYIASLTPGELAIQKKIQPPVSPAQFLGPEVTLDDLTQLIGAGSPIFGTITSNVMHNPLKPGGQGSGGTGF